MGCKKCVYVCGCVYCTSLSLSPTMQGIGACCEAQDPCGHCTGLQAKVSTGLERRGKP